MLRFVKRNDPFRFGLKISFLKQINYALKHLIAIRPILFPH